MVGTVPVRTFTPRKKKRERERLRMCALLLISCSVVSSGKLPVPVSVHCFNVVPCVDRRVSENNENTECSLSLSRFITSGVRQVKVNLIKCCLLL